MKEQLSGRLSSEPALGISIFDELESYATTDMDGQAISRLINETTKYTDKGTVEFEGELELGDTLGDGIEHYEFYLDSESQMQVLTDLFSLTPQEES
jgi:hypothetical protein